MPESAPGISGSWSAAWPLPTSVHQRFGYRLYARNLEAGVFEREGGFGRFTNQPAINSKTLVLDISNQCQGWDDSGLLNLVFHPGFATNRYIFVYYTWVPRAQLSETQSAPFRVRSRTIHDRLSRFHAGCRRDRPCTNSSWCGWTIGRQPWHNGNRDKPIMILSGTYSEGR